MTENLGSFYDYLIETSQGRSPDSLVKDTISCVAISPDNQIIVGGGWKKIIIWNAKTGELLRSIDGHSNWVLSVAISPDNKFIASGSADKTIKVWSRESGKLVKTLKNHSNWVNVVAFTPDGKTLVSGSADKTVKVWNFSTGKCQHTFKKHSQAVRCLAISSDGEILASGSADKTIKLWDLKSKKYLHSFAGHSDWVQGVYLSPNKEELIGISRDGEVKVWQAEAEENEESSGPRFIERIKNIAINLRNLKNINKSQNQILFEKFQEKASKKNKSKIINSLAIIRWEKAFITGTDSGNLEKFSLLGLTRLQFSIKSGSNFITSIAVSSDNKIVVSGSENWAKLWNLKTGELLHPLKGGSPRLCKITISPKSVDLKRGKTQFFKVKGFDQNNSPISVEKIDWSVTGRANKIDQNGNLTVADDAKEKFKVIATAEANISAEAEITPLVLTSLEVTPRQLEIHPGKRQKLTVRGKDQKGQPIETGEISWKVTPEEAGNIDQDDNLTVADNAREKFKVIATATKANISAEAEIIPLILTYLEITPKPLEVYPGSSHKLTVRGKDQNGQPIDTGEISWKVTPEEAGNLDQNGNLTVADNAREKFKVIATATEANISAEAEITPLILTFLKITARQLEIHPGSKEPFTVEGKDQKGQPIETGKISWRVEPEEAGNIDQDGNLTVADNAKEKFKVIATATKADIRAEAEITPLILTSLEITPESLEINPGKSKKFIVEGKDQKGQPIETGEISWSVTGTGNKIDRDGNLTVADNAKGKFKVIATATEADITGETEIIVPAVPVELKVFPEAISVKPEEPVTFEALCLDQHGEYLDFISVNWQCTAGGSIDDDGTFVGGYEQRQVTITARAEELRGTAIATLLPVLRRLEISPNTNLQLKPGDRKEFRAVGYDQYGQKIDTSGIFWEATGGKIDSNGVFIVDANAKGTYRVTASEYGIKYQWQLWGVYIKILARVIDFIDKIISFSDSLVGAFLTNYLLPSSERSNDNGETTEVEIDNPEEMGLQLGIWSWLSGKLVRAIISVLDWIGNKLLKAGGISASVEVRVIPVLKRLEISSRDARVECEKSLSFALKGFDQRGEEIAVEGAEWQATGGTITAEGVLTAGDKEDYITVTAVVGEISDRVVVEVRAISVLKRLEISPRDARVECQKSLRFALKGFDQRGEEIAVEGAEWQATGGTITAEGVLTAGDKEGYITVTAVVGEISDRVVVKIEEVFPRDLIEIQRASFRWFLERGLIEELESFSPITDYTGKLELHFLAKNYKLKQPKYNEREAKQRGSSYTVQMYVPTRLLNKETGDMKEQSVFIGDLPLMTDRGSFIINGAERVIVNQIVRSPGVYYKSEVDRNGRRTFSASLIPNRGAWLKFETDKNDLVWVKIDKTRKLSAQVLLKALGLSDSEIFDSLRHPEYFQKTIEKEGQYGEEDALMELYRKLRPGEPPTVAGGKQLLQSRFFDPKRYDLGKVGRYKLNKKLRLSVPETTRVLTKEDILAAIDYLINLEFGIGQTDDIDHLGNRRVRSVGELLQNQIRVGLNRLERIIRERMTVSPSDSLSPTSLVNPKPLVASIKEFFGSSQLSQFLDQTNPLAELTHKRRISALGPGGLTRERAGFAVRDIHPSHYGRICPIETPEGPNAGLIGSLATHAWVNGYGFIETPYFQVENGRVLREKPPVFMTADEEDDFRVAPGDLRTDSEGYILGDNVPVRYRQAFTTTSPDQVDFVAVSPVQVVSVTASLIPFLEHDDANRALMGSKMQRQAVPLLKSERPLVGTGLETQAARDSGMVVVSKVPGEVSYVDATQIRVLGDDGIELTYDLLKYARSNQDTCLNQRPLAYEGDRVEAGEVIADGSSTEGAELALGENVLVAYMPWEGYNYADAILISERLVADDVYTSIHIEKFEIEARQTKLGPEEITREIPNVGKDGLRNLDDQGIIRIGAWVESGEILVGKVTPKGESDKPPEEKLLRAIFGERARDVRDNSLRVPNGEKGRVVDVRVFTREKGDELPPGANMVVRVYVAQKRKIQVGDKMAGRHGNKGVVSRILPIEDMPFLPDGRAIDLVLNPLGVPSQMNVGQIFECLLGWAGEILGARFKCVPFDEMHGAEMSRETVHGMLRWAREISGNDWVFDDENPGKIWVYDGRTGERFDRPVTVGIAYMLKLVNLVDDKIHARSTGPYSLLTQQPLGGKAQQGGQRFGEMEIWALEAFGAAYTLQELLTVKSDDMQGRNGPLNAIVKGKAIPKPGTPESFKTLMRELQSLCLDIAAHKVEVDEHTGMSRRVEVDLMAETQRKRLPPSSMSEPLGQEDEDE